MLFSAAFIEKAIYIFFLLFIYYIKTYTLTFYFFWEFSVALPGFLYLKMRYWFKMYFNLNSNGKWSSKNFQILSKFNKNAKHVILHSIRQFLQNSKFDFILIYPYQSRTIVSSKPLPWYFSSYYSAVISIFLTNKVYQNRKFCPECLGIDQK